MKAKFLLLSSLVLLGACSEEGGDITEWMNAQRAEAKMKVRPVEEPAKIEPVTYLAPEVNGPNAFSSERMRAAYQNAQIPDLNRPKELLENYSLENLKYVGSIGAPKALSAMIEVEGHVYKVNVGNHLGQNFGRITQITPDAIKIVEIVEDVFGNWSNRRTEILLDGTADSSDK